jgi:hypothetical protein
MLADSVAILALRFTNCHQKVPKSVSKVKIVPISLQSLPTMEIFIIHNLKVGDRNGKSHLASRYMPFLHDTFWHFSALFGDNR